MEEDHDPVPPYTLEAPTSLSPSDVASFLTTSLPPTQRAALTLPITKWPTDASPLTPHAPSAEHAIRLQQTLVTTLFTAVAASAVDVPPLLVSSGLLSPDVPDAAGATPLLAAVAAGSGASLCALLNLGADPNRFGRCAEGAQRTPLMLAAQLGRLPLVKVLVEDFGADDALVAEDGYIALRLAAEAGQREVVAYLPSRRAGAGRRLRWHFEVVVVRRVKKLGYEIWRFVRFFVWDVPRCLVCDCLGRGVVMPLWRGCKWCWGKRGKVGRWCREQARKMPGRMGRAGKAVWKSVKAAPGVAWKGMKKVPGAVRDGAKAAWKAATDGAKAVWKVAKAVPGVMKRLMMAIWRVLKAVPGVVKRLAMAVWKVLKRVPGTLLAVLAVIGNWLKRAGGAVANVVLRVVSVLHTAVTALLGWFRTITLKDVWNGVCAVLEAVFVDLPKALWSGVRTVGEVVATIFLGLFGFAGQLVLWLFQGLWWLAKYIPERLWKILCGIGSALARGFHEVMVLFNPKY